MKQLLKAHERDDLGVRPEGIEAALLAVLAVLREARAVRIRSTAALHLIQADVQPAVIRAVLALETQPRACVRNSARQTTKTCC